MGGKVAPALDKFKDFMMKKLTTPENLKKIMGKMSKKVAEYATAATGVGFFVAAAAEVDFSAEAFNSGMNNAESLLKIPSGTATTGMKLLCGFTSAILQAIPVVGWVLEPEDVMDSVIDIIGPVVGVTQDDLKKIRETGKNEDKGIVETAKDAAKAIKDKVVAGAGSVWDGVKGFGASLYDKASKVAGSVWDPIS